MEAFCCGMGNQQIHLGAKLAASPWHVILLFLVFGCPCTSQKIKDCPWPEVPEHGGFQCAYLCSALSGSKAFSGTTVEYYCESGYTFSGQSKINICKRGKWTMNGKVSCQALAGSTVDSSTHSAPVVSSLPIMAVVAVTVSSLLLVAMACVLLKPKSCFRQGGRNYERMEDPNVLTVNGQPVLIVNGQPVLLPSYEEAVYGSRENENIQSFPSEAPTSPVQEEGQFSANLGTHEPIRANQVTNQNTGMLTPPPAYEEIQPSIWLPPSGPEQEEMRTPPQHFLFNIPTTK